MKKKKYGKTYLMFVSKMGIGDRYRCDRAEIEWRFLCKFYLVCVLFLTDFAVKKQMKMLFGPSMNHQFQSEIEHDGIS